MADQNERRCLLLLAAIITLLFADVLLLGNCFYVRDLFSYHFPMKSVVRQMVLRGEFPWWNPYFSSGQPMAANPAYEIFYPLQWLIFIGPYRFGFALHVLTHVYLAATGAFAFFRSVPLRRDAAAFGALSFSLSGLLLGTSTNLPTFFVWCWAGWVAWATLRVVRGGGIGLPSLVLAMPMLVGEPVSLVQTIALVLIFGRSAIRHVAAFIAVALLIASVQIIPAVDHARDSIRGRGLPFAGVVDYSMPASRALEFVAPFTAKPNAYGPHRTHYFLSIYFGAASLALLVAGLATRQRGSAALIAIAATSFVLALGDATPLWRILYAIGVHGVRYPEKWIASGLVTALGFATITAERLLEGDDRVRRISAIAAAVCAVTAAIVSPISGAIFAALAAVLWFRRDRGGWYAAAVVLLVVDAGLLSLRVMPRRPAEYFTAPAAVSALDEDRDQYAIFHRGEWTQRGAAAKADTRDALRPYSPAAWGFRTALEADLDETALLPTHDLLDAMQRLGDAGAPHWSERVAAASNVRYILDYAANGGLSIERVPSRGRYSVPDGRVVRVAETSSGATLDVDAKTAAPLLITITRHKYWSATIDGQPAPLAPANVAYQKLDVPAGTHRVVLRYRNPLIYFGAALSVFTILALLMKSSSGKLRSR